MRAMKRVALKLTLVRVVNRSKLAWAAKAGSAAPNSRAFCAYWPMPRLMWTRTSCSAAVGGVLAAVALGRGATERQQVRPVGESVRSVCSHW